MEDWQAYCQERDILWPDGIRRSEMAELRANGPYIWVTWLTKLLVGENSCEWAAWFRTQHENWSWNKVPDTTDWTPWRIAHTARINEVREELEAEGYTVFTEGQNWFSLRGNSTALGGKPDLIARKGTVGTIIDIKTGQPSPSRSVQVTTYMYAVPRALGQYRGVTFDGKVIYADHEVPISVSAVDDNFIENLAQLIRRLGSSTPARKVPSRTECGFCNITKLDCPERAAEEVLQQGATEDF